MSGLGLLILDGLVQVVFFVGVQLDITLAAPESSTGAQEAGGSRRFYGKPANEGSAEAEHLPKAAPVIDPRAKQGQRSVVGTVGSASENPMGSAGSLQAKADVDSAGSLQAKADVDRDNDKSQPPP